MTNAILAAILVSIESNGNDLAIGDNGTAIGPLQIRPAAIVDVNRRFKTQYVHSRMTNRVEAIEVLDRYLWIYATPERLGRPVTDEDRARIWNGGPNGWKKSATLPYLEKYRAAK